MAVHLNPGHDIETASQMLEAINSFRGVSGVKVKVCNPPPSTVRKPLKWEGVSFISNIQYSEDCLRVWRAYNTGPGKCLPWSKFNVPDKDEVPSLLSSTDDSDSEVNFVPVKLRRAKKATPAAQEQDTVDDDADASSSVLPDSASPNLFACPEEGCIKT